MADDFNEDGLSEEELAALKDDDPGDDPGDDDALDAPPKDDPPPEPPPEEPPAEEPPADDDPKEKPADGDDETPEEKPADDQPAETPAAPAPTEATFSPVDEKELEAAKEALDKAQKEFDDGLIDFDEFNKAQRAFDRLDLKREMAEDYNKFHRDQMWKSEQKRFFDDNPDFVENASLNLLITAQVNKMLADETDSQLSDAELLAEAKKRVEADLGAVVKPKAEKTGGKTKEELLADAKKSLADRGKIPQGLRDTPAADTNNEGNRFAWLDALAEKDPAKLEKELEKLSDADREAYEDSH